MLNEEDELIREWERVFKDIGQEFGRSGVPVHEEYLVAAISELMPNDDGRREFGDLLYMRDYNASGEDCEKAWYFYKNLLNDLVEEENLNPVREIEFDPPNFKDLGRLLIGAAERITKFRERLAVKW